MTAGDFVWCAFTTCSALFLLWPMCRATAIVDKTGDIVTTLATGAVCVVLMMTIVRGLHSLWWAATHGLVAAG